MDLTEKKCVPCQGGEPPMLRDEINKNLEELGSGWELVGTKKIRKDFEFKSFKELFGIPNKPNISNSHF